MREECEPLDLIIEESHDLQRPGAPGADPAAAGRSCKERGLWATHLGPHLGGPGYGQVKLALLNEILGPSECAPIVFGSQAPDSGNSEILAHYGTPELKARYLEPLLDNRIVSCFSMTEPQGGADPKVFTTAAVQDGDEWVINGEKWFSSFADMAVVPHRDGRDRSRCAPYERHSMFVVPRETPGINVLRNVGLGLRTRRRRARGLRALRGRPGAGRPHARTARWRVRRGADAPGRRPHPPRHAHRRAWCSASSTCCASARCRATRRASMLGNKQLVQEMIADSWMEIESFRLLTLQTAWKIDQYNDYKARARRHLRGQGDDAEGAARRVGARAADSTGRSASPTRCRSSSTSSSRSCSASPTAPPRCTRSRSPASC